MYLADSSRNFFWGCLSKSKNSSPPGQKSVMRHTCVLVCEQPGNMISRCTWPHDLGFALTSTLHKQNRRMQFIWKWEHQELLLDLLRYRTRHHIKKTQDGTRLVPGRSHITWAKTDDPFSPEFLSLPEHGEPVRNKHWHVSKRAICRGTVWSNWETKKVEQEIERTTRSPYSDSP